MTPAIDRRRFLALAAGGLAAGGSLLRAAPRSPAPRQVRAILFDGFAVFDPRPVAALAETIFPGKGGGLADVWRSRQFEYQWLRALSDRYADFRQVTEEALVWAARSARIPLDDQTRARLMEAYHRLDPWPEVPASLASLRRAGLRLAFLSNMTGRMLTAAVQRAGMGGLFEQILSTDSIRSYKPDSRAYRMAIDALSLDREEMLFVASAGWDAAGARWFGYPTYWVNRLDQPAEELGVAADAVGRDFRDLEGFVLRDRAAGGIVR